MARLINALINLCAHLMFLIFAYKMVFHIAAVTIVIIAILAEIIITHAIGSIRFIWTAQVC